MVLIVVSLKVTPGFQRQRMIEDMTLRKLSPKTQSTYIRAVINFTRFLGRSPDTAMAEDMRRYQLHLFANGISTIMLNTTITALRFFFGVTLDRGDAMARMSPVRVPHTLPAVPGSTTTDEHHSRNIMLIPISSRNGTIDPV